MTVFPGRPPRLNVLALPPEEHKDARAGELCMFSMDIKAQEIEASLRLFDHASALRNANPDNQTIRTTTNIWKRIAGRDGALRVKDLEQSMEGAKAYINRCPTLGAACDRSRFNEAQAMLERWFPDRKHIRNAAGHTAYQYMNDKKKKAHSTNGPQDNPTVYDPLGVLRGLTISDSLFDRRYTATFEGQTVTHEVSQETVDRIYTIVATFFSGLPSSMVD